MPRRPGLLLVGIVAGFLGLSCDEGRFLTELEGDRFATTLSQISGVDTMIVGATHTFKASAAVGGATVTADVIRWTTAPHGLLSPAEGALADSFRVQAVAPGEVVITATVEHPDLEPVQVQHSVALMPFNGFALLYDGGDYATVGDTLDMAAVWTVEAWVKPIATAGTQYVLSKGGTSADNAGAYGLYLSGPNPAVFVRWAPGGVDKHLDLVSSATTRPGEWAHLAASYDGALVRLFLNGDSVAAAATVNAPQNTSGALTFGASSATPANGLTGSLDEVRFWSVTRTPAEIRAAGRTLLTGSETGLRAYWPFDAGIGNPVDLKLGLTAILGGGVAEASPSYVAELATLP